jgi:hypothetical protein
MRKDNSTFDLKVRLRRHALREVATPVVMETHGGRGRIGDACYQDVEAGVVFEKDPAKVDLLARKRPTWAVYECDCETAIQHGAGAHLEVNFLDLDPYGDHWPVLDAFFTSDRPRAATLQVLVNDGLRQKVKLGCAWNSASMSTVVLRRGNDLYPVYLEVCKELLQEKAALAGYRLDGFQGYYCGHLGQMTHYWARLVLGSASAK